MATNDDFIPPIKERTTEELLQIVGSPKSWKPKAVKLALEELDNRNVPRKKIETAKYLANKRKCIKKNIKANESYCILDFILSPIRTWSEILFTWELKKDGYLKKARQQQQIRVGILLIIIGYFLSLYMYKIVMAKLLNK